MESKETKALAKLSKQEVIDKYVELLNKNKELLSRDVDHQEELHSSEEKTLVDKALQYTVENIITSLAELNVSINKALADLSDKLTKESGKLGEIKKAIEIETKNLKELHQIDSAANALKALLKAHDEEKGAYENAMVIKRNEWLEEQERHKLEIQERNTAEKKERVREEEEYMYALALARKKDSDAYEEKKKLLEKELVEQKASFEKSTNERLASISLKEAEFEELKHKVTEFPKDLEDAVNKSKKETQEKMKNDYETRMQLMLKEIEGEKKLFEFKIASLNEGLTKQTSRIEALNNQLNDANRQVQDIAIKAIEGASSLKALSTVNEIALEQAKNVSAKK